MEKIIAQQEPRVIGVVGGLGPFAGVDLVRKIIKWTRASQDQDHLPVMLHSFPGWVPDRSTFLLGKASKNPGEVIGDIMAHKINWEVQWGFVFKKTIPLFWYPAHTITFLLPGDYQVLFAAFLGVVLGLILSIKK